MANNGNTPVALRAMHGRIGLLGGSFNPAHAGHVYISEEALRRLKLDAVWWLVSPHNPLKQKQELGDYEERLAFARAMTRGFKKIVVSDIERKMGTRYTIDSIEALQLRFPRVEFIWLMGADNLVQFNRWKRWAVIFNRVRVAVFDRAPHAHKALRSKAALRFRGRGLRYIHLRRNPLSATQIRKNTPSMRPKRGI